MDEQREKYLERYSQKIISLDLENGLKHTAIEVLNKEVSGKLYTVSLPIYMNFLDFFVELKESYNNIFRKAEDVKSIKVDLDRICHNPEIFYHCYLIYFRLRSKFTPFRKNQQNAILMFWVEYIRYKELPDRKAKERYLSIIIKSTSESENDFENNSALAEELLREERIRIAKRNRQRPEQIKRLPRGARLKLIAAITNNPSEYLSGKTVCGKTPNVQTIINAIHSI